MSLRDMKEALSSARKPDITHVRKTFMIYTARPCEYGADKYVRANYLRPVAESGYTGTPTPEDLRRFQSYLRAAASHIYETLDAIEALLAVDPELRDVEAMKRAAYAADTDVTPGAKVGASMLPHVAPACASLQMAICQAVACGLLPADPGRPWETQKQETTPTREAEPVPAHEAPRPCMSNECEIRNQCTGSAHCTGERRVPRSLLW